jgi:hypothetical protein
MNREDCLQLMSCRLYDLLGLMMYRWRNWAPKVGWYSASCGFASGGSVSEFEDLEESVDAHAVTVLETGWTELSPAERLSVEMAIGVQPWVWTVRPGVYESAIAKLEKKLRELA